MTTHNLSEYSRQALQIAQSIAKENVSPTYSGPHLLKAVLHNEIGLASELVAFGKDVNYLKDWADYRIESSEKATGPVSEPGPDKSIDKVLEVADVNRIKLGLELLTPMCILIALVRPDIAFSQDKLKTLSITENELIQLALENASLGITDAGSNDQGSTKPSGPAIQGGKTLMKFCNDKTQDARDGKLDEIIGREGELRKLKEIIGRRTKPNVIIVGEPGVGKSALIEGFAQDLVKNNVPEFLHDFNLLELDLETLIAIV